MLVLMDARALIVTVRSTRMAMTATIKFNPTARIFLSALTTLVTPHFTHAANLAYILVFLSATAVEISKLRYAYVAASSMYILASKII